jgi:hypothetical protein
MSTFIKDVLGIIFVAFVFLLITALVVSNLYAVRDAFVSPPKPVCPTDIPIPKGNPNTIEVPAATRFKHV